MLALFKTLKKSAITSKSRLSTVGIFISHGAYILLAIAYIIIVTLYVTSACAMEKGQLIYYTYCVRNSSRRQSVISCLPAY